MIIADLQVSLMT